MGYVDPKQYEKGQALAILMNDGIVVELPAKIFFRSNRRKPEEPFAAYRRGLRNAKKAYKMYRRFGVKASVLLNKETMVVL